MLSTDGTRSFFLKFFYDLIFIILLFNRMFSHVRTEYYRKSKTLARRPCKRTPWINFCTSTFASSFLFSSLLSRLTLWLHVYYFCFVLFCSFARLNFFVLFFVLFCSILVKSSTCVVCSTSSDAPRKYSFKNGIISLCKLCFVL